MDRVLLGRVKVGASTYADGEPLFITKHKWDCGWYWGFGYIGNRHTHFHFDSLLTGSPRMASDLFSDTKLTDAQWWIIRDLFIQAYALHKAAAVYRHGGHQTSKKDTTDLIQNPAMAATLNADLQKVLDALWAYVVAATS